MQQLDMEMATTNRIGKLKMKLLKYMDDEGYIETPRPGKGLLIAVTIGFLLAPVLIILALYFGDDIDRLMTEFLKWLMI